MNSNKTSKCPIEEVRKRMKTLETKEQQISAILDSSIASGFALKSSTSGYRHSGSISTSGTPGGPGYPLTSDDCYVTYRADPLTFNVDMAKKEVKLCRKGLNLDSELVSFYKFFKANDFTIIYYEDLYEHIEYNAVVYKVL